MKHQHPFAILLLASCFVASTLHAQQVGDKPPSENADIDNQENAPAANDAARPPRGSLVRIPLPLTGSADLQVRRVVNQILANLPEKSAEPTPIVVFEFWCDDDVSPPSEFGRAIELAEFLTSKRLSRIRTVAYIPDKKVQGHAVLVALACQEIVMHPEGQLGNAGILETQGGGKIPPHISAAYKEIANRKRTVPEAVALGMLDPDLQIHRLETVQGQRYVTLEELPVADAENPMIPAGEMGNFTGAQLRETHRIVSRLATDRTRLAREFGMSPADLEVDPSLGDGWRSVIVDLNGPISPAMVGRITRTIDEQIQRSKNLIILRIDSPGGHPDSSLGIARYLSEQSSIDSSKVRTVAYVPRQALADASIVVGACDQIVLDADAIIGGDGAYQMSVDEMDTTGTAYESILRAKRRSHSIPIALLRPDYAVFEFRLDGSDVSGFFHELELKDQDYPNRWKRGREITTDGEPLELNGNQAIEFGLADEVASSSADLATIFHLEGEPEVARPNWANELVHKLAMPQVAGLLLFVGVLALFAELSSPGIGVGAFVSAVCFLLFFWSQFLNGTAGWLEVLLFFAGVVFILIEVLVIPGFGIFGVGGGLMIIASLVLASQTFVFPQNAYQMQQLPKSLMVVAGAGAGVIISLFVLRKHLQNLPFLNRMMLKPMDEVDIAEQHQRELFADYRGLLHQVGRATTPLIPAGKAKIENRLVDVVSTGEAIDRGSAVRVVEVAGNRVVVELEESA